ncbi:MAG: fumarylacetoacetate hydrolase family protein [Alphaproteobacteria bacterium]|nr:fumarylacetoacetate hydrolase family protein [Alphaproteobacteria bacterium]
MDLLFPTAEPTVIPVLSRDGGALGAAPIRRVYCVGRNYAAHAVEMGHDPNRESPFFFQKNPDNVVRGGGPIPYPPQSDDVHHEVELVVMLKSGGSDIAVGDALDHVLGYGVGVDLTRRDLQGEAKKAGRPWEIGKAFEKSAPVTSLIAADEDFHLSTGAIWLTVNGETRQQGDVNQMIWKTPEIIAYLSRYFTLAPGDMIMTGTPAGVGPVQRGDRIVCGVDGLPELHVEIV